MTYSTYHGLMTQMDWPASKTLRSYAQWMLEARTHKEKLEAELRFINKAVEVVLLRVGHASPEAVVELAEEIGDMHGDAPYNGSDPAPAWTWAGEALETAGIGSVGERHLFDDEDAEGMVFVPSETFDSVTHEVEASLRRLLSRAKKIIDREPLAVA